MDDLPGVVNCVSLKTIILQTMRIILRSLSGEAPGWAQTLMKRYPNACRLQSITDPIPPSDDTHKSSTLILQDNLDLTFYSQFQQRDNVIHVLETFPHVSFAKFKRFRAIDELDDMLKYIEDNNLHKETEDYPTTFHPVADVPLLENAAHPIPFQLGTLINATIKESSQPAQFWQILERLLEMIVTKAIANDALVFPSLPDEEERAEMYDRLFGELAHFVAITMDNSKSNRINALLKNAIERFNNGRLRGEVGEGKLDKKGYLQITWRECPIRKEAPLKSSSHEAGSKMDVFVNALFLKQ
jgi:hypothetical protein